MELQLSKIISFKFIRIKFLRIKSVKIKIESENSTLMNYSPQMIQDKTPSTISSEN